MADFSSHATRITLYRNGDSTFTGRDVIVPRHIRSFDTLLDIATKSTGSGSAVRKIYTPMGRHSVNNLMALNHKSAYVAVGREGFKKVQYGKTFPKPEPKHDGVRLPPIQKPRNLPNAGRALEVYEGERQELKRIHVYLNGDCLSPPVTVLLRKKFQKDMERVFNYIQESRLDLSRPIGRLYTVDGREIFAPKQLQNEGKYVAVERGSWFKPMNYSSYVYCPHYFPPIVNSISDSANGSILRPTKKSTKKKRKAKKGRRFKTSDVFGEDSPPVVRPKRAEPNWDEQESIDATMSSQGGTERGSKGSEADDKMLDTAERAKEEAEDYEDDHEKDVSLEEEKPEQTEQEDDRDDQETPRESEEIPREDEETPRGEEEVPRENEETPRENEEIPRENEETPRENEELPREDEPAPTPEDDLNDDSVSMKSEDSISTEERGTMTSARPPMADNADQDSGVSMEQGHENKETAGQDVEFFNDRKNVDEKGAKPSQVSVEESQ